MCNICIAGIYLGVLLSAQFYQVLFKVAVLVYSENSKIIKSSPS